MVTNAETVGKRRAGAMAGRAWAAEVAEEGEAAAAWPCAGPLVLPAVGLSPSTPQPVSERLRKAFRSSRPSGFARRLGEKRAHQRPKCCATALWACDLGLVVLLDREGDLYLPAALVTVVLAHWHGGSSSRFQGR